jgi:hypothetical protein
MVETKIDAAPDKVFLFSGHMIDAPTRDRPRFPPQEEATAKTAITALLDRLGASAQCLAVCSGACGGDLLFAEAVLQRRVALEMYLPFDPPEFEKRSVDFAGAEWRARFEAACAASTLHVMPRERDALPAGTDPYEQNNRWMLDAASRYGAEKVDFICLWNGQDGDGLGGAQHMMQEVGSRGGRLHWLNTTHLWNSDGAIE